jgi:hypothetical protein
LQLVHSLAQAQKPARFLESLRDPGTWIASFVTWAVGTFLIYTIHKLNGRQRFVLITLPIMAALCVVLALPAIFVELYFGPEYATVAVTGTFTLTLLKFGDDGTEYSGRTLLQQLNDYLFDKFYPKSR